MKNQLCTLLSAGALLGLLAVGTARADTLYGSIYEGVTANATPANVPTGTPNFTFTTNSPLNFNSNGSTDYTIGSFLGTNPGGYTINSTSPGSSLNDTLNNTLFNFTGNVMVTNGETFTVSHDDGMTLVINGVAYVNDPGPSVVSNQTVTYTGPTGIESFQLVYGETHGAPAMLQESLPLSSTPEPSSMLLLGTGLLGMGGILRRKITRSI